MKLKLRGFRQVEKEKTIDVFEQKTFDDVSIKMEIKESGNCLFSSKWKIIGWIEDKFLAFHILKNVVPLNTYSEFFHNRGEIKK